MLIKINHVAEREGRVGIMKNVLEGDVKKARFEVREGARLIEGILIGRHYSDMSIIAQRICGVCSVAHNLTSIKSLETAMGVEVSREAILLRKVMQHAQFIYSHALHLFFLSLTDHLDIENDLKQVERYPIVAKKAIEVREFGMKLKKTIGGRAMHPVTNEVGGFKKVPTKDELRELVAEGEKILETALELGEFFKEIKLPEFERETEYVCLRKKGEYAMYEGNLISNKGLNVPAEKFEKNFHELHRPREIIKRVEVDGKTSYMVGAIARVNNQSEKLSEKSLNYLQQLPVVFPDYNPFHNVWFQMVEVLHCIEESTRLMRNLLHLDLENALTGEFEIKEGVGVAVIEAPRGTLYYHVDVDEKGYIKNVNIIPPTAQFLAHLEDDIAKFTKEQFSDLKEEGRKRKMRAFIRAYDPCVSCAVH